MTTQDPDPFTCYVVTAPVAILSGARTKSGAHDTTPRPRGTFVPADEPNLPQMLADGMVKRVTVRRGDL